ncbi:hypothetical protein L6164_023653 [Bauhinia variegata]|uniref:Uncharacterized protein n=1 Tax=Bauhinia variegata TaxID=167791 RepID=A0ACB9MJG7_BAUVA|nr:hypothetical protein L6164_023653 [Bauhinia variegata]
MALNLVNRAKGIRASSLLRFSFNYIRNLSAAPSSSSSSSQNPNTSNKSKQSKKKNLFEVAQFLPNWGIGYHMAKNHWAEVSYEITKINLYKDGRHGKAWGVAHKNGLPIADAPKKISGVHKRCWRYIPKLVKSPESFANSSSSTEGGQKLEPIAN